MLIIRKLAKELLNLSVKERNSNNYFPIKKIEFIAFQILALKSGSYNQIQLLLYLHLQIKYNLKKYSLDRMGK